ncbi:MAG: 3-dehydroquinate dehydratase [Verrucomicrobiota bacterium]|jgi:3-dehydroquinate dehydratase-1
MTARRSVKTPFKIVGVIASSADLSLALRLRQPPDFFELRLDLLFDLLDEVEKAIPKLKAPLIVTARHPLEGGANNLSIQKRRALLLRFLPRARYVDLELRSVRALKNIVDLVREKQIGLIVSFHDLKTTPPVWRLREKARAAQKSGADIFKIATRTDNRAQLQRLLDFQNMSISPTAAMGIGRLGRQARLELMRRGSVLNYVSLSKARVAGQLSLREAQRQCSL